MTLDEMKTLIVKLLKEAGIREEFIKEISIDRLCKALKAIKDSGEIPPEGWFGSFYRLVEPHIPVTEKEPK